MKTILRLFVGLGSLAILLMLAVGIAGGALLWTDRGKDLLRGQTERIASAFLGPALSIEFGRQEIGFGPSGTLGFVFSDIAIRNRQAGRAVGTADSMQVGIGLGALLRGKLVVERLSIATVRLDPSIQAHLRSGRTFAPADIFTGLDRPFAALEAIGLRSVEVSDLAVLGGASYHLQTLEMAASSPGVSTFEARGVVAGQAMTASGMTKLEPGRKQLAELTAQTSEFELLSSTTSAEGSKAGRGFMLPTRIALSLAQTSAGRVLTAAIDGRDGRIDGKTSQTVPSASVRLRLAEGEGDVKIGDGQVDFGAVKADFIGRIALIPDKSGRHQLELGATRLSSTVGQVGKDVVSGKLALLGGLAPGTGAVKIDRFSLETGKGELAGTGELTGLKSEDRVRLNLTATALAAADVKAFWPFFVADNAREWVLGHVKGTGSVPTGSINLDFSLARLADIGVPGHGPVGDEVRLAIDLKDVAFATIGDMPAVEGASGTLEYRGGTTLIALSKGRVVDFPDIAITPSSMDFSRTDNVVAAALSLNLAGDASALLRLADRKPVDALQKLGWGSDEVVGNAKVGVGVAFLLGQRGREKEQLQNWSVVADLDDVDLKRKIDGRTITNVSGLVSLAPGAAIGEVEAAIDGIPAKVAFSRPIAPNPIGVETLDVTVALDDQQVRAALPALDDIVDGPVSGRLSRNGNGYRVALDLGAARLRLPAVGWNKGPRIPAKLTLDLKISGDTISMRDVELSGEGFSATGTAEVDAAGLKSVTLASAALNRGDQFSGRIARSTHGYTVEIAGRSLDARAVITQLREGGIPIGSGSSSSRKTVDVAVAVDRLLGFGSEELQDATIRYSGGNAVSLKARTPAGDSVTLSVVERDQTIDLATGDAGSLLRFGGLYTRMQGGVARLQLAGADTGGYSGALTLADFTLVDEPRLASLVGTSRSGNTSLASALDRDLEVSRAYFDSASARLAWDGQRLAAQDGILRGPIFGSSFEGTIYDSRQQIDISGSFMPAYAINRLFGALPFVGGILGNGTEGALIGITYRLSGAFGDPTLTVNPISAIAPGIFRRIFEY